MIKAKLKPGDTDDWERVRCLRHGDFTRLFQDRYYTRGWYHFPDDSAGRDDLWLFVVNTSMAAREPKKKMCHIIDMWAPWMSADERDSYVELVWGLDFYVRHISARELGRRLGVTNAERKRLKLWQFKPIDATDEQLEEERKARRRENRRTKRRVDGAKPREAYLAEMTSKPKPWIALGISRATYYRRVRRGMVPIIVSKAVPDLVSPSKSESQKGLHDGESSESQCNQTIEIGVADMNEPSSADMVTNLVSHLD
jgi:hypothetical protein